MKRGRSSIQTITEIIENPKKKFKVDSESTIEIYNLRILKTNKSQNEYTKGKSKTNPGFSTTQTKT